MRDMVVKQKMELSFTKTKLRDMEARLKDSEDQAEDQRFELRFTKKEVKELKTENAAELSANGGQSDSQ
ncbi:unnamed protein product [Coregonus sp. 'balchen']|nr:unnamed protein product [Coregonus sp. 'balchen']